MGKSVKAGKGAPGLAGSPPGSKAEVVERIDGAPRTPPQPCAGGRNRPLPPRRDSCHGQEENRRAVKDQVFRERLYLQSPHAHSGLCGYPLGRDRCQPGCFRDPALQRKARREAKGKFEER
ncbi:large ribosomal subunit protein eL27-like [Dasypus novemcinctus]|uniref:large ribosomal subunit protein eL27-like n=1 Tax=Dasypus novemcinctus TaxID=9361 RepID=UPI0039C934D0